MAEVRAPGRSPQGGVTPSSLGRGTRLGRYELLAPIGVGGMAKVWAARQSGYGGFAKVVAIKTILPHLSRESDFERLFVDEARVASLVRHPNVCEIFELSEEGQVLFLVMEWVDGDSLIKLLKPGTEVIPFDPRIAARIGAETCAGIHAAHIQHDHEGKPLNIVHRDVSPHNILLSAEGVVKVTDFGVAKAAGQTHDQTVAGQLKGKLEYMSPEQITGVAVDARTDVFGMGGVIYEATTGHQPFEANADLEVMTKIVEGRMTPPSTYVKGYPRELEAILYRAMAKEQSDRFASADEMRIALETWLARSGPPVTHAEVATLLRSRVGPKMDERLDRIRAAMSAGPDKYPSHTPSGAGISTSGVIPTHRPVRVGSAPGLPPVPSPSARQLPSPPSSRRELPAAPPFPPGGGMPRFASDPSDLAPDSGFNMDTVADYQVPDYLDPDARLVRAQQPGPVPVEPPPVQYAGELEEPAIDVRQYILAAVIGVVVAVALGGAGLFVWHLITPDPVPAAVPQHAQPQAAPSPASPARPANSAWRPAP
jgi:serine/threonine protein kinase